MTGQERALQSRFAVELLSNKWRIAVLHLLRDGAMRHSQIQSALPRVSPKMLTQTLRGMERDGLILRRKSSGGALRVEYELTGMAKSLLSPLQQLCHWAKAHVQERDAARVRFRESGRLPDSA